MFATLDEPTDSRLFQEINYGPADDGGWWQMFAALVDKYGLVPKSAYPESANSKDSDAFKQYLNSRLRQFAADLRERYAAGATVDELRAVKDDDMSTVYRMCAISLGEPPEKFDFLARVSDDDKKDDKKSGEDEADKPKPARTSADRSAKPASRRWNSTRSTCRWTSTIW